MKNSSKEIKITIVTSDEKTSIQFEEKKRQNITLTHDSSMTIMSTLLKNGLIQGSFCGGRGDCGRCRIQFIKGVIIPTMLERSVMSPEELRQGYRLACLARPKDDCVIRLAFVKEKEIAVISEMIAVPEKCDQLSQQNSQPENQTTSVLNTVVIEKHGGSAEKDTNTVGKNRNVAERDTSAAKINRNHAEKNTDAMERCAGSVRIQNASEKIAAEIKGMIAVDLGTTTIAMQLMEIDSGKVLDTYCVMNPQRRYGSDVISRIRASCEGQREELQNLVLAVLKEGVIQFRRSGITIQCMCIAGNTAMGHLLMGYDVLSLSSSPFAPVEIGLQEYEDPDWEFKVWIAPGISAFVGGDIVAGLYALELLPDSGMTDGNGQYTNADRRLAEVDDRGSEMLIDLGTNGEMAITDGKCMIVTATAAGPAFEGGAGAGIVGSDMIANTAQLLRRGVLDETGLLEEPWFSEGIEVGKPPVRLFNKDIRALQMAKAAVRAGVEILWKEMKYSRINRVYLAGGFGYYLDVEAAFRIGLLPVAMRGRVITAGNTSLAGAYRIGRDLLNGKINKESLKKQLSFIESINLAEQQGFDTLYIRHMDML